MDQEFNFLWSLRSLRWPLYMTFLVVLIFSGSQGVSSGAHLHRPIRPCGPCWCNGTMVDCSGQQLTQVPSPASGLPSIATSVSLRNNSLSSLGPADFSQFPSLRRLDLSHNVIDELNNNTFGGLKFLEMLNISCNRLTLSADFSAGGPFDAIRQSLVALDLSNNFLANMNPDVFRSMGPCLKWLSLSRNNITYKNESEWPVRYLQNLTFLDISHNNLSYVMRTMFNSGLHTLNISHNRIPLNEDGYPDDAFEKVGHSLTTLKMRGNCNTISSSVPLSYPHKALSKLRNLQILWIDGLNEEDFGVGFKNLTSMWMLVLSGKWNGFCNMSTLSNTTFENIHPSLRVLDLSHCAIRNIDINAFAPLRDFLKAVDLSYNPDLGFDTLGEAFYSLQGSKLTELYVDAIVRPHMVFNLITERNTRHFRNTSLELIAAKNNHLEVFCPGALNHMPPSLTKVILYGNSLKFGAYFKDMKNLVGLKYLEVDGIAFAPNPPKRYPAASLQACNVLPEDRSQCIKRWSPYKSHPMHSFAEEERHVEGGTGYWRELDQLQEGIVYELPPKLQILRSRWNQLYFRLEGIHFDPNNSLVTLDLHNNLLTAWTGQITGLNKLETLNLNGNLAFQFHYTFFENFTSLKNLTLSNNYLREALWEDEDGMLFASLRNVKFLDLSKNYLNYLPRKLFRGLISLQTLNLTHNDMTSFDVDITHMENLTTLDLSMNFIKYLTWEVMEHLNSVAAKRIMEVHVDMTYNPLSCTCEHKTFLTWIEQSAVVFPYSQHYTCLMSNGDFRHINDLFKVISDLKSSCIDKKGILIGAVVCMFCLVVAFVGALMYRFRWKLRYLYYASRLAYRRLDASSGEDCFDFDAFVSYSSENNDFVQGELLDELETRAGLRLNVHSRDFTPGMPIPTNIVDAVQSSRRTLVVLSQDLLQSDWCHYELQMATMEASYTGRDVLLFLLYEDVPSQQLPREILYNLQSSTYINYPGATAESSQVRDFWERLAQAIKQ